MRQVLLSRFMATSLSQPAQSLLLRYLSYGSAVRSFSILSDTFLILYVLDSLGYAAAGALVAIRLVVQGVFDYPTGILSDLIGQKLVLTLSFGFYSLSYALFSLASSYSNFLLAYVFFAIGYAQQSGTLQTWFDNQYRVLTAEEDPDRTIYKVIIGKSRTIIDLFGGVFLLIGGYLATTISREFVFKIQVVAMVLLIILTWFMIDNISIPSDSSYLRLLSEGVTSIFASRPLLLMVLAAIIFQVGLSIWGDLIIFPMYFGYTGTDFGASTFRFILFISGSVALWLIADRVGTSSAYRWLPKIHLFHTFFFYGGLYLLLLFLPFSNTFSLLGVILSGFLIFVSHMLRVSIAIWIQQIYLDLIPDNRRNGFYSFVPTVVIFMQAPFTLTSGGVIENQGYLPVVLLFGLLTLVSSVLYYLAMQALEKQES